jgi:hypothetical protein
VGEKKRWLFRTNERLFGSVVEEIELATLVDLILRWFRERQVFVVHFGHPAALAISRMSLMARSNVTVRVLSTMSLM